MQPTISRSTNRNPEFELFTVTPGTKPGEHSVLFYGRDESLVASVCDFAGAGLGGGEGVVLVVTSDHAHAIRSALKKNGLDVRNFEKNEQLVVLDARQTLDRFLVDGMPDEALFNEAVGCVMARLGRRGRGVRAFGEMVALLWAEGKRDAALHLEHLWNLLATKHEFSLLCGYPISGFEGSANSEPFLHVCREHTHVIPVESYAAQVTRIEQSRMIAMWQQKAASLEAEIRKRKQVEAELRTSQEELRAFVDNAALGLHWIGPDGIIQWANRAELQMLGYASEDTLAVTLPNFTQTKG